MALKVFQIESVSTWDSIVPFAQGSYHMGDVATAFQGIRHISTLETTQGQIDGFCSQLPFKCYLPEVAFVGD